ncbi:MAG: SRPBCC domain-containing protein [Fimbriimonadaceae bacterium]
MQDTITKELVLPADPNTVWEKSFSSPEALASWFPERVEVEFTPGATGFFSWGEHRCEVRIVTTEPPTTFAYQWHPGDTFKLEDHPESELTTVTFTIEPHPQGTKVTMIESGFANISESRHANAIKENTNGWTEELAKLSEAYQK